MKLVMPGNNFNQRGWVHLPSDICRTIIGGGGGHGGYPAGNEPKVLVRYEKVLDCGKPGAQPGQPQRPESRSGD